MHSPLRLAALSLLPVLVLVVAVCIWNPAGDFWKGVEPPKAQCEAYDTNRLHTLTTLTAEVYDQRKLDRLIREPQNTVSNLAYVVVGLAILLAGRTPAAQALGVAGIFLGFGSGMYHASLLAEWRLIDILGVYAVLYALLLAGAAVNYPRLNRGRLARGLVIAIWTTAIFTGAQRNNIRLGGLKIFDSTYVFVGAVAVGCVLAVLAYRKANNRRRYLTGLGTMAVSAGISFAGGIGDRFGGYWAAPEFLIQGHAVWHVFGAVAMLAVYEAFAAAGLDQSTLQAR